MIITMMTISTSILTFTNTPTAGRIATSILMSISMDMTTLTHMNILTAMFTTV